MEQPKVLIVDDMEDNTFLLQSMLEDLDIELDISCSSYEAVSKCEENQYAIAIVDINMPEMDGFECVKKIKSNIANRALPVIYLTAEEKTDENLKKTFESGGLDYINKPFNFSELKGKVKSILDIHTANQLANDELKKFKKQYHDTAQILNQAGEGVISFDEDFIVTYANSAAGLLLTSSITNLLGSSVKDFMAPAMSQDEWIRCDFVQVFMDGQCNHSADTHFWRNSHSSFPVQYTQATINNADSRGGIIFFIDNSETQRIKNDLLKLANYDHLTKIPNRTMFLEYMDKAISYSKRNNSLIATILIDLDNFKEVNDSLGHSNGDSLLIEVGKILQQAVRNEDLVARLGGDEFSIALTSIHGPHHASFVANKILDRMKKPISINGCEVFISCSIGITIYPDTGKNAEELLMQADSAMYHAKRNGKNSYEFFSGKIQQQVENKIQLANDIRSAVSNNEFEMYLQPQTHLQTGAIIGAEALIRWKHATKGFICPSSFIPIAEEIGVINDIGEWCINEVCYMIKKLSENKSLPKGFNIAINISARQLNNQPVFNLIQQILLRHRLPPKMLHIEVTETTIMDNPANAIKSLQALRELGIKISVDDFGTGYSSLSYLKKLPLDVLKIDREFVKDIGIDKNDETIIKAIILLARSLGLDVVAEGIETEAQSAFLRHSGCLRGQGYLFSKPMPYHHFQKLF